MISKRSGKSLFLFLSLLIIVFFVGCGKKEEPADLVLMNGKIVTVDEAKPEAQALAIRQDKIVAVGSNKEIKRYMGKTTKKIELGAKLAIPGFIDSHGHFTGVGESRLVLNLMKVKNWDEIVAMVKEAAAKAKPGEWILGRGWHQEKWNKKPEPNVNGLPFHHELSKVSLKNPVLLEHASGHSTIANAKAMELAGITRRTHNPPGGEIIKDSKGNPIGVFLETAQGLPRRAMRTFLEGRTTEQKKADSVREIELSIQECLLKGVTSFHDAGASMETIDLYKELADQGKLEVRLYAMVRESNENLKKSLAQYRIIGAGNNHLTVRSIKIHIDGALGAHGAWLLEPYTDLPASVGLNTSPIDVLKEASRIAIENDFQVCTHAIGDRGNREILNIYEEAFKAHPEKKDNDQETQEKE